MFICVSVWRPHVHVANLSMYIMLTSVHSLSLTLPHIYNVTYTHTHTRSHTHTHTFAHTHSQHPMVTVGDQRVITKAKLLVFVTIDAKECWIISMPPWSAGGIRHHSLRSRSLQESIPWNHQTIWHTRVGLCGVLSSTHFLHRLQTITQRYDNHALSKAQSLHGRTPGHSAYAACSRCTLLKFMQCNHCSMWPLTQRYCT